MLYPKIFGFNGLLFKTQFYQKFLPSLNNLLKKLHTNNVAIINENKPQFDKELTTELKLEIENKWKTGMSQGAFDENSNNEKYYVLSMFPYPSGNLHMGHVRVYTISDAIARFHRLNGKNVLQPIGFDAFGLPAENAARDRNIPAAQWTEQNINEMRVQLKRLGISFDWNMEVITCYPEYYKWTQFIFLLLYREGLVYRDEAVVNWDPVDKTVLADEQVNDEGRSWRSGELVERKTLKQWFIRTTYFAHALYTGLDDPKLKDWKDIVALQKHWIGECDGASFFVKLYDIDGQFLSTKDVWIKYPEMMHQAAFLAVTSDSVLGKKLKTSPVKLVASLPFSQQRLPVFVVDNLNYPDGCDSKLGTPLLSEEDAEFADKHGLYYDKNCELRIDYEKRFRLCRMAMKSGLGGAMKSSKLRDWLISRQRHWGTPIPIIHCRDCGPVPVPSEDLPVCDPKSLAACPKCGKEANRETDTMDTFVDSAWYFLRYVDIHNNKEPFAKRKVDKFLPVDVYVGGKEHAVLHLYYARFISYFLHFLGLVNEPEPFKRLLVQGMVTGKTYFVKDTGKYLKKTEVLEKGDGKLVEANSGNEVVTTWEKMSKTRFNGVEPDEVLKSYGTDTTRLIILANVAPTSQRRWSDETFPGILNWQKRIWALMDVFLKSREANLPLKIDSSEEQKIYDTRNYYIKGTTFNYACSHQLSVAISKLQGLTNSLKKFTTNAMCNSLEFERTLAALIIMLSPMAPHFSSELWYGLINAPGRLDQQGLFINWNESLLKQTWPTLDKDYKLEFICKVNNSVKSVIKIPFEQIRNLDKNGALELALAQHKVQSFIKGCDVLNCHYEIVENYEAIINIEIDHMQRNKFLDKSQS